MLHVQEIIRLFESRGGSQYGGEAVTQLEHALQCATLAESEAASPELVVAALLHDIGHLLHELPDDTPYQIGMRSKANQPISGIGFKHELSVLADRESCADRTDPNTAVPDSPT